jgi:hypothetical protein
MMQIYKEININNYFYLIFIYLLIKNVMKKQHAPFLLFLGVATLGGMIFYQATNPFEWASLGGWVLGISWVASAFYLNKKG